MAKPARREGVSLEYALGQWGLWLHVCDASGLYATVSLFKRPGGSGIDEGLAERVHAEWRRLVVYRPNAAGAIRLRYYFGDDSGEHLARRMAVSREMFNRYLEMGRSFLAGGLGL